MRLKWLESGDNSPISDLIHTRLKELQNANSRRRKKGFNYNQNFAWKCDIHVFKDMRKTLWNPPGTWGNAKPINGGWHRDLGLKKVGCLHWPSDFASEKNPDCTKLVPSSKKPSGVLKNVAVENPRSEKLSRFLGTSSKVSGWIFQPRLEAN